MYTKRSHFIRRRLDLPKQGQSEAYCVSCGITRCPSAVCLARLRQRSAQKLCDLYFNPPLTRVGMLQWNRFEVIVQRGYTHALEVLAAKANQS